MSDLLPCPFCGGTKLNVYKGHGGAKVQCYGCGVSGVHVGIWNRRDDRARVTLTRLDAEEPKP